MGFDRRQAASRAPFLPELPVFVSDRIHHDRRIAKDGGVIPSAISVQVLNEFTSVALRKLGMKVSEIREALEPITAICQVVPLTQQIHNRGLQVAERYRFSFYDALIVAAALESGCTVLYSEDMQDGQVIQKTPHTLTIKNSFRA